MPPMSSLSVTQLVRKMRNLLEIELGELWVEGEVSNLRRQASGHYYFSLKDEKAQMTCAMFSAKRRPGAALLQDGAKVRVFAEVTVYEARGQAQMIVKKVEALGQGDLQAKFEALKAKLNAEGLFDADRKREIAKFPQKIGIVTSPTGAALQDMLNVLERRAPWLTLVLYPALVQGAGAENGIAAGIKELDGRGDIDTIIIGRGGGSMEDLWNFNEEIVARAIASCETPVISAVGHEIDFTIADFVADLRAPTPSAAAELVAPDRGELQAKLDAWQQRIERRVEDRLERSEERLAYSSAASMRREIMRIMRDSVQRLDLAKAELASACETSLTARRHRVETFGTRYDALRPERVIGQIEDRLARLGERLHQSAGQSSERKESELNRLAGLLQSLGPQSILARGYSLTFTADGQLVRDAEQVIEGESITTQTASSKIESTVSSKISKTSGVG